MDTSADVIKKLKVEEVTESSCENYGLNSRSKAACRDALIKCHPTGKNLN